MRRIADLPGPSGLPLLGNLLQVGRDRIHRDVERWAREHGPLFRFAFGRRHILGVADHELLNTLLRDRPDGFRRTRHMELISREMGLTPGLFGSNDDAWRSQRRMVMAGLDPNHVREYFPSLLKVTQRLHGRWQQAARAGTTIELQPDLMRFTVDAIAGLAFGADINTLESDADIIQHHLDKIFPALFKRMLSLVPVWRWRRSKADRELEQSVAAVNVAIGGFIAQARARLAADAQRRSAPPNLLESMIVAADSADSGLTDVQVAGNVMTMLLAGEDTTANTLAWMIYLMHRHPEVLARARAEVLGVAGRVERFDPQCMAGLDYLEACAHETMRLKPVAPFQAIEALRDTTIGDVQVPRGTIVWCVMRADSLSDAHFPDAAAFKPERWLGDDAAASPLSSAKRVSMPFGAGPRVCPGRYLALLEIKMAMAMLLAHFEIDTVATPDGSEPAEHMSFTMSPLGLSMRLRERA